MTKTPDRKEKLEWLRLARSDRVGPRAFRRLIDRFGSPARALERLPEHIASMPGARRLTFPPIDTVEREMDNLESMGGHLLILTDPRYPRALRPLDEAPPVLSVLGHPHLLGREAIAIVGTRNPSAAGLRMAGMLSRDLGRRRFIIASGMARGIDAAAHDQGLDNGTVAVMAGGVDVIYPRENRALYQAVRESGAIVSEQPFSKSPSRRLFPQRNRIIAGLSVAVVVVEAARGSGSLITARFAAEQGRDVFAVPGSPADTRTVGSNALIRDGATLVQNAGDVITSLSRQRPYLLGEDQDAVGIDVRTVTDGDNDKEIDTMRTKLRQLLGPTPIDRDELTRLGGIDSRHLSYLLTELEIAGLLVRYPGNLVALQED